MTLNEGPHSVDELSVRVIPFSKEQCPFDKKREHTWQEWHSFRNAVLDILLRYAERWAIGQTTDTGHS
jgi:hypothetical protein